MAEKQSSVRAIEFYAGIGGLHFALARSHVDGTVIRAYDWDQAACQVYQRNHDSNTVKKADISLLSASETAELYADLWLMSPSCQPYTVLNPMAKGAEDPRAKSFIHLMENVLPELVSMERHPQYLLVENVAGFETSSTRERLLRVLDNLGYTCLELLLTPLQFGIPNSRLRYYLLAKNKPLSFANVQPEKPERVVWRHIPGHGEDWLDERNPHPRDVHEVRQYLDEEAEGSECKISDRVLEKWGRLFDIVLPSNRRTCCFTRGYTKLAERAGSVLQLNEGLDTTTTFDTFLAEQNKGNADAVRLLDPLKLRYFSPSELLRLFCFDPPSSTGPGTFAWPDATSTKTKYKLIGNSVNVEVVRRLTEYLFT